MKTTKMIVLALALAGACSCTKDTLTKQEGGEKNFSISATADGLVKTAVDAENYITWKAGDALSVWEADNAANSNVQLTLAAASAGQRTGAFEGTLTPAGTSFKVYAMYPYAAGYGTDPTAVAVNLPATVSQCATLDEVVGVSDFMFGEADLTQGQSYEMGISHPLAILDFVVDGSGSVLRNHNLASVTMTANVPFVGAATADVTARTIVKSEADAGKTLVINFPDSTSMNAEVHAYVAIYPTDLTDAGCKFVITTKAGQILTFTVNPKMAFEASKVYTLPFKNLDKMVDEGKAAATFFNLVDAAGGKRANCYIISEGGYYRFAAQRVDHTNCFEGDKPYTNGYRADWLWAMPDSTAIDLVGIGNSGSINFRCQPGAEGNTVIALRNPSGKIVWSWHIWCCKSADIMTPLHWSRNSAWMVSDINLGATSKNDDETSFGLYYQWGRKDPFPADGTKAVYKKGYSFSTVAAVDVAEDAIAYSIENPTKFIKANNYHTWLSTASQAENAKSLWNSNKDATAEKIKSNYDPCPVGYGVPLQHDYAWQDALVATAITNGTKGFTYNGGAGNTSFYPAAGYLKDGVIQEYGTGVRMWSAAINGTPSSTANLQAYGLNYQMSNSSLNKAQSTRTAFALPVRCMKLNK